MTAEHVPPRSVGNNKPVAQIEQFDLEVVLKEVAEWHDGHVVRTLDAECNRRASDWGYVREYRKWHSHFVEAHRRGRVSHMDPFRGEAPFEIELPYDAMPARFMRQVVGMLLALQESHQLFAAHQDLVELIGPSREDPDKPLRGGVDLEGAGGRFYLSVFSGKWWYANHPIGELTVDLSPSPIGRRSRDADVFVLALAPFAFVFVDGSQTSYGLDITDWAGWDHHRRPVASFERRLSVPTVDAGPSALGAMLYPEDYGIVEFD